jgi:MFS family permease
MSGLAGTVTNVSVTVATGGIAEELGASLDVVATAVLSLNLSMAIAMPLAGLYAGRIGLRGMLVASGLILALSSVVLIVADGVPALFAGRLGQGVALAGITPTAVQAAGRLLPDAERGRALGWWSVANGAGLAVGPLVGGRLFDLGGWAAVPVPTVGIGVVSMAVAASIPRGLRQPESVAPSSVAIFSLAGGLIVTLLSALSTSAWTLAVGAAAALGLVVAGAAARRRMGREALVPAAWTRDSRVLLSTLGGALQMFANGLVQVAVPAWLLLEVSGSIAFAGLALMAMTVTMTLMAPFVGRRVGAGYPLWFLRGCIGCGAGLLALAIAVGPGPWALSLPALIVVGVGAGCLLTPSFHEFSRTVAGREGVGLALYNMGRLVAFAAGGLFGAVTLAAGWGHASFLVTGLAFAGAAFRFRRRPSLLQ